MNHPTNLLLVVVGDIIELILVLGDHFFQLVHLNISWINILLQKASYIRISRNSQYILSST